MEFVLDWEGRVLEYDHDDPGGATFAGIDQRDHPNIDVRHLNLATAKTIYYNEKWLRFKCDHLPQPWDLLVLDSSVNPGPGRHDYDPDTWGLVDSLQECCGAKVDGYIGPETIKACTNAGVEAIKCFLHKRQAYYDRRPAYLHGHPFRVKFGPGWTNRTNALKKEAIPV